MEIWTGLVCLVPDPTCKNFRRFGDGKGAYVNVVAWAAESAKHFEQRVTASAEQLDCIIREVEKVELLEAALQRKECPEEFFIFFNRTYMYGYPRIGPDSTLEDQSKPLKILSGEILANKT